MSSPDSISELQKKVNANSGWLFSLKDIKASASSFDGIEYKEEVKHRREGCKIIWEVGVKLNLKEQQTLHTACTFFHRFYMVKSFKAYPLEVTALGCLFLAGKVEETPKKCADIVRVAAEWKPKMIEDTKYFTQEVFNFEKVLISTLGFDLYLENPYIYLVKYAKIFKLDPGHMRDIVQFAWTFLNDCAGTTLALQYEPEIIAIAILQLAFQFHQINMTDLEWENKSSNGLWWDMFVEGLTTKEIDDACHFALDYYETETKKERAGENRDGA